MRRIVLAALTAMIALWFPTVAHAIDSVVMNVYNQSGTLVRTCPPSGSFSTTTATLTIPNCSPFKVTAFANQTCAGPVVAALQPGGSENQLAICGATFRNVSGT